MQKFGFVFVTLLVLLALGALAAARQERMQNAIETLQRSFTMPIREVPNEEMLVFGVDTASGRAPLYRVLKFKDDQVTCYVLMGEVDQLSCVK